MTTTPKPLTIAEFLTDNWTWPEGTLSRTDTADALWAKAIEAGHKWMKSSVRLVYFTLYRKFATREKLAARKAVRKTTRARRVKTPDVPNRAEALETYRAIEGLISARDTLNVLIDHWMKELR